MTSVYVQMIKISSSGLTWLLLRRGILQCKCAHAVIKKLNLKSRPAMIQGLEENGGACGEKKAFPLHGFVPRLDVQGEHTWI